MKRVAGLLLMVGQRPPRDQVSSGLGFSGGARKVVGVQLVK